MENSDEKDIGMGIDGGISDKSGAGSRGLFALSQ
jgi:hypothetical protein